LRLPPIGLTLIATLLVLAGLHSAVAGLSGDEAGTVQSQGAAEKECPCRIGGNAGDDALKRLLSSAVSARDGLEKLQSRKDDYAVTRIVYRDVYATEVLQRTWTMEPDSFRQDTLRDGLILKSQQYDGKTFLESYGRRVRFGLEKDLRVFLENVELNRIFSLVCVGTEPYPARLGQRVRGEDGWLREVIVEAPSGLTYRLFLEEETCLIARLEYVERVQYAETEEVLSIVTHVDSYRKQDGMLVADRLRLFSRGTLKAEVSLVEYKCNVGLSTGFFSPARLRRDVAENPLRRRRVTAAGNVEEEWKGSAYRKIVERLQTHDNCRFKEVASYGDPRKYHERLFESGLVLLVDPKYLEGDDVLAFYAELLPAPSGFYEDCIALAATPESASVSGDLLLHETTHAILRRGQEVAPLAVGDDEFLAYYQGTLFGVGSLLEWFERIVFDGKGTKEPQDPEQAARVWRTFMRNLQQVRGQNRMTKEALEQFREWCGVDFDLRKIRLHYLELGVDPACMPMDSATGNATPRVSTH